MVGVDGSSTSDAAIATAFDEASWRGPCTPGRSAAPTTGIPGVWTAAGLHQPGPDSVRHLPADGRPADRELIGTRRRTPDARQPVDSRVVVDLQRLRQRAVGQPVAWSRWCRRCQRRPTCGRGGSSPGWVMTSAPGDGALHVTPAAPAMAIVLIPSRRSGLLRHSGHRRLGIVAFGAGWSWVDETKDLRRRAVRRCRALSAARSVVPGSHAPRPLNLLC